MTETEAEEQPFLKPKVAETSSLSDLTLASIGYVIGTALSGITYISMSDCIDQFATDVGESSVSIGSVFILRGIGSVVGTFITPVLLMYPNIPSIEISVIAVLLLCVWLPFNTSLAALYIIFFLAGTFIGVVDTGCMTKLRQIQGQNAGAWMSANIAAFSVAGMMAPLLQIIWDNVYFIFFINAGFAGFVLFWLVFQPKVESCSEVQQQTKDVIEVEHYYVEYAAFWGIFGTIGGSQAASAYIEAYVDDTGIRIAVISFHPRFLCIVILFINQSILCMLCSSICVWVLQQICCECFLNFS